MKRNIAKIHGNTAHPFSPPFFFFFLPLFSYYCAKQCAVFVELEIAAGPDTAAEERLARVHVRGVAVCGLVDSADVLQLLVVTHMLRRDLVRVGVAAADASA